MLSASQSTIVEKVCKRLRDDAKYTVIRGGAGTGKSYLLLKGLYPAIINEFRYVQVVTTTNQANDSLNQIGSMPVQTIHSFLGIRPSKSKKILTNPVGFEHCGYYIKKNKYAIPLTKVLIIDEAFRLDSTILSILDYRLPEAQIIFIGDPYQTPPVGLSKSPIEDLRCTQYELTEQQRFNEKGSLGATVSNLLNSVINKDSSYKQCLPLMDTDDIKMVTRQELKETLDSKITKDESLHYTDMCILTATKDKAFQYNQYVMKKRADLSKPILTVDDPILVDTVASFDRDKHITESEVKEHLYTNAPIDKQLYVKTVATIEHRFGKRMLLLCKAIGHPILITNSLIVIAKSNNNQLDFATFRELVSLCYDNTVTVVTVSLNVALTIHKAQGISSKTVYLDIPSIASWKNDEDMVRRLLYTGVSRCSDNLRLLRY